MPSHSHSHSQSHHSDATILLPSLPTTLLLGLDTLALTPSPQFIGFKDTPPGWHFLYAGANAVLSTRTGYWLHVPSPSNNHSNNTPWLRIFHWNTTTECLEPVLSPTELSTWQARLKSPSREVHGRLLPYDYENASLNITHADSQGLKPLVDFRPLTAHISASLLNHMTSTVQNREAGLWLFSTSSSAAEDRDDIPGLADSDRVFSASGASGTSEERELSFLGINLGQTWRKGAVGRERTIEARDRSAAVERLVAGAQAWDGEEEEEREAVWGSSVLGTMQVVFVMTLLVSNWSCLQEWRRVLGLVLTCRDLVSRRVAFYCVFLRTLRLQLERCGDVEGGLFDVQGEGASFLLQLLREFEGVVGDVIDEGTKMSSTKKEEGGGVDGDGDGDGDGDSDEGQDFKALRGEMDALEGFLAGEWGWTLRRYMLMRRGTIELEDGEQVEVEMEGFDAEDETGEYAPVVVDLGE